MTDERSIGLRRGTVRLLASDPAWPRAFRDETGRLARDIDAAGLPPLTFEHIGSTAVPGLDAKPIIDFLAGYVGDVGARGYQAILIAAGYAHRGPQGVPDRELFVLGPESRRTHHLSLVAYDGAFWRDHIAFRDRLRGDASLREEYATLKRRLAAAHPDDRAAYTSGKAAFVARTMVDEH
jgi:GrpB-like predicted nucleotidyltransferase (UPF0157 family)